VLPEHDSIAGLGHCFEVPDDLRWTGVTRTDLVTDHLGRGRNGAVIGLGARKRRVDGEGQLLRSNGKYPHAKRE